MNIARYKNIGVVVGSLAAGGGAGFWIAKKRYERIANEEIASVKETYDRLSASAKKFKTPAEAVKELVDEVEEGADELEEKLETLEYASSDFSESAHQSTKDRVEAMLSKKLILEKEENIFEKQLTPEEIETLKTDPNKFVSVPSEDHPFIISVEDFMDDDEYTRQTIVYYEEDDTLVDDRDQVIPDVEGTVGSDALTKFGTGSSDKDIVYVRNNALDTQFEVVRNKGSFTEVVLGYESSEKQRPRKMRDDE